MNLSDDRRLVSRNESSHCQQLSQPEQIILWRPTMTKPILHPSLPGRLLSITLLLIIFVQDVVQSEEGSCLAESRLPATKNVCDDTTTTMMIGDIHPAPILVVENFLPEALVRGTFDNLTAHQGWVVPVHEHTKYYERWLDDYAAGFDGDTMPRLMKPPRKDDGTFPGIAKNLTVTYKEAVVERVKGMGIKDIFELTLELDHTDLSTSFFGNVCYNESSLGVQQRAPHVDMGQIKRRGVNIAIVHYISPTFLAMGGTSFYRQKSSGGSNFRHQNCVDLKRRAKERGLQPGNTDFLRAASCHCRHENMPCHKYLWYRRDMAEQASYSNESTNHYELLHHVPYKFNTAVIYDTKQLHSAFIDQETLQSLSCDPKEGRVTANIFLATV